MGCGCLIIECRRRYLGRRRKKLDHMWREEHRLRVFENTVLKKIFGPKKEEVTAE